MQDQQLNFIDYPQKWIEFTIKSEPKSSNEPSQKQNEKVFQKDTPIRDMTKSSNTVQDQPLFYQPIMLSNDQTLGTFRQKTLITLMSLGISKYWKFKNTFQYPILYEMVDGINQSCVLQPQNTLFQMKNRRNHFDSNWPQNQLNQTIKQLTQQLKPKLQNTIFYTNLSLINDCISKKLVEINLKENKSPCQEKLNQSIKSLSLLTYSSGLFALEIFNQKIAFNFSRTTSKRNNLVYKNAISDQVHNKKKISEYLMTILQRSLKQQNKKNTEEIFKQIKQILSSHKQNKLIELKNKNKQQKDQFMIDMKKSGIKSFIQENIYAKILHQCLTFSIESYESVTSLFGIASSIINVQPTINEILVKDLNSSVVQTRKQNKILKWAEENLNNIYAEFGIKQNKNIQTLVQNIKIDGKQFFSIQLKKIPMDREQIKCLIAYLEYKQSSDQIKIETASRKLQKYQKQNTKKQDRKDYPQQIQQLPQIKKNIEYYKEVIKVLCQELLKQKVQKINAQKKRQQQKNETKIKNQLAEKNQKTKEQNLKTIQQKQAAIRESQQAQMLRILKLQMEIKQNFKEKRQAMNKQTQQQLLKKLNDNELEMQRQKEQAEAQLIKKYNQKIEEAKKKAESEKISYDYQMRIRFYKK